jgi:DMSO/TMAO reductase YedYZ molybdopterin-dependent catalytic subunit
VPAPRSPAYRGRVGGLLTRRLPEPPSALRRGPLREGAFRSPRHEPIMAVRIGRWLGAAFAVCFATGLISHYMQQPPDWLTVPSRPVWLYRLTQGVHVATGIACIPLLLAKLWTVYPRLWVWPPARSVLHGLERLTVFVLVASAIFQVVTGLVNTAQWYPWGFYFPRAHYYVAWIAAGSVVLHIAIKLPVIANAFADRRAERARPAAAEATGGMTRRGVMIAVAAAVGAVTVTTVGQTLAPLRRLTLLAPRRPDIGPQGFPVNRTAAAARVMPAAFDPAYRLVVTGPRPFELSLEELRALPQHEAVLPITCVEGWSASARWRGVRVRDLLERAGAPAGAEARVVSLEPAGIYRTSRIGSAHVADELTLLALDVNGEPLALDHGYPLRLIAPNRPGVLQTKWVTRLEVLP